MTIDQAHSIYLVGIKGVAMASIAQCLLDMGKEVRGCDTAEDFVTAHVLSDRKITIDVGFDPMLLSKKVDLVIYTGAHQGANNPIVVAARQRGLSCLSQAEALGHIMATKKAISVCGTGGKSTTSAMIAWILQYAEQNPSYSIGVGNVPNLGKTGAYTDGAWFVAEADEYAIDPTSDHRPRFVYQHPDILVCPSLSYDHPDIYPDIEAMQATFASFFATAKDAVFVNADVAELLQIYTKGRETGTLPKASRSVGFSAAADIHLQEPQVHDGLMTTQVELEGETMAVSVPFPGRHVAINAVLAFLAAERAGVERVLALEALRQFAGTMRRFTLMKERDGIRFYDDYAHTPSEISTTIAAMRSWEPGKHLTVVFQPHTFSRTKALFAGFVESLALADEVVLIDIFASARESRDATVRSDQIVEALQARGVRAVNLHDLAALQSFLQSYSEPGVVLTMGAGDIYTVYEEL